MCSVNLISVHYFSRCAIQTLCDACSAYSSTSNDCQLDRGNRMIPQAWSESQSTFFCARTFPVLVAGIAGARCSALRPFGPASKRRTGAWGGRCSSCCHAHLCQRLLDLAAVRSICGGLFEKLFQEQPIPARESLRRHESSLCVDL